MTNLLLIGFLGLVGTLGRYGINSLVLRWGFDFPVATIAINILGSFLIGLVAGLGPKIALNDEMRIAIMAGLLGGFTTFSAFSLDALRFIHDGQVVLAFGYLAGSVLGGVCAAALGMNAGAFFS